MSAGFPSSGPYRRSDGSSGRATVPGARWADNPDGGARPPYSGGGAGGGGWDGGGRGVYTGGRGPRPRWKRIALVGLAVVVVLGLVAGVGGWFYAKGLDDDLGRTDPFAALAGGRPKSVSGALNILMVGTDSRDPDAPLDKAGEWRSDTIILMHIPASHDKAYLVSIPRDLYVPVPKGAGEACDSGDRNKINAAFALGGLPLAVRTVECFTDVHVDHVMAVDFGGFKEVTDALGGVDLKVERSITSIHKPFRKFTKGTMHMDGATALDWVRQRKQFPEGDFARMRHQQEFLKALMDKAASTGTLTNPAKLNAFLKAVTKAVTVDQEFSVVDMAVQFRNLRGENLQFLTSPNLGGQDVDGQSVVVSDKEKALGMYQAMATDKMAEWVEANLPRPTPKPSS
jgi:LCP family protein required for cell wall assembly